MSSDEDNDMDLSEIDREADEAISTIIPEKSRSLYEIAFNKFTEWLKTRNIKTITEKVMLAYFLGKSTVSKCSTMWSEYSKLRTMINIKNNVDIGKFTQLIAFLKRKSVGHVAKKSKVFSQQDIEQFLLEADDETFLLMKVLLIVGIAGACRRAELLQLSTKDVIDVGEFIKVEIHNTKTKVPRQFTITSGGFGTSDLLVFVRKYSSLRSHDRFFVAYRNGKCTTQPVGVNTIGAIPKKVATYLGKSNPELYTGHCLRRTSATWLADSGAGTSLLKRHGGWKSTTVAEGYVESSVVNKCKISKRILGESKDIHFEFEHLLTPLPSTSKDVPSTSHYENILVPSTSHVIDSNNGVVSSYSSKEVTISSNSQQCLNSTLAAQSVINLPLPSSGNCSTLQHCTFNNCTISFTSNK